MILRLNISVRIIIRVFLIVIFIIKSPLYLFHFWLPKAHVEASVTGSIILAGIILKIGGFGIYRIIFVTNRWFNKILFFILI
jgi:NADH-ubiquinone oxidoreductase chain 4